MLECYYAYDSAFSKSELTGRLSGAEVVDQLAKVSKKWDSSIRLPYKDDSSDKWHRGVVPPDLILATNMISVGLDVDRFNTIVMNSMPRNIAEYIQASSRVARNKSGLVIALHNPFRARDLSHFERFIEFHEKLYYYVEPISITPFSKQAVSKYLPLYLAAIIRHKYENLANVDDASKLTQAQATAILTDLCEYFKLRLSRTKQLGKDINGIMTDDLERNIELVIEQALQQWQQLAADQKSKGYFLLYSGAEHRNRKSARTKCADLFLPLDAFEEDKNNNFWSVPMSLRNVEPEAVINIDEQK